MSRWSRFWFAEGDVRRLGLVRQCFGLWLVLKGMGWNGLYRIHEWPTDLRPNYPRNLDRWEVGPGAWPAPLPGLGWLADLPFWLHQAAEASLPLLGLWMMVGLGARVATGVTFVVWSMLFGATENVYTHHGFILWWVLLVLAVSPVGDHHALDARLRRGPPPPRRVTGVRLLQALVTLTYASAWVGKLTPSWLEGRMMQALYENGEMPGPLAPWVMEHVGSPALCGFTLVVEGLLPIGLWVPRLRWPTALAGAALHLGIDLLMPVTVFSYMMISLYVVFFPATGAAGATTCGSTPAGPR